jgi:hypothetical protein
VREGAIEVLASLLLQNDPIIKTNVFKAISNLSDKGQ